MRKMRRESQLLDQAECQRILEQSSSGTLACLGDDDWPYAVPLSHVYIDGKLYFHGALTGHRIDAIERCEKVSYAVIEQDQIVPEKLTTYFRSVIVFGRARLIVDERQKRIALWKLAQKYAPQQQAETIVEIDKLINAVSIMVIDIETLSGKEAIELKMMRQ